MKWNVIETAGWTRARVEAQLVAAFRAMPHLPVLSRGATIRSALGERTPLTETLEWTALCAEADRKYLLSWARCRATRDSFSDLCARMGWRRSSAEDGRRRAALAIAAALADRDSDRVAARDTDGGTGRLTAVQAPPDLALTSP